MVKLSYSTTLNISQKLVLHNILNEKRICHTVKRFTFKKSQKKNYCKIEDYVFLKLLFKAAAAVSAAAAAHCRRSCSCRFAKTQKLQQSTVNLQKEKEIDL